jgi:hypothetical protein
LFTKQRSVHNTYIVEDFVIGGIVTKGAVTGVKRLISGAVAGGAATEESMTLYRAVSQGELDDIGVNGIRNSPGYETGKLFATTAEDAANYGRMNYGFDKLPFTIIRTSLPKNYSTLLYRGEMDLMEAVSVPSELFNHLSKPSILNYSPIPNHPWIK